MASEDLEYASHLYFYGAFYHSSTLIFYSREGKKFMSFG